MPIYRVEITAGAEKVERLIEAANEAQARHHVTKKHITVELVRSSAQIKEMAALAAKGVQVEAAESE